MYVLQQTGLYIDSAYGLSGGVSFADAARGARVARAVLTGTMRGNGGLCSAGDLPFGGYKTSGIGREWGLEARQAYLETKLVATAVAA